MYEKAKELGATLRGGINWTWADFPDRESAEKFIAWLDANGGEHRGIYEGNAVRFR